MATTIKVTGGDMGCEELLVRCNLSEASAPVEMDYCTGRGWRGTQYQCADARHTVAGLGKIAKRLAAAAVEMSEDEFSANCEEVE